MTTTPLNDFDFSRHQTVDEIEYEILAPDGVTGTGWIWTLGGPGHDKAVAYQNEQSKKNLRESRMIKAAQINGKKFVPEERTVEQQRRDNAEWVFSRVLGWSEKGMKVITGNDEAIPFNQENAIKVLTHPGFGFVFTQLVEVVAEDKRFTKGSATT